MHNKDNIKEQGNKRTSEHTESTMTTMSTRSTQHRSPSRTPHELDIERQNQPKNKTATSRAYTRQKKERRRRVDGSPYISIDESKPVKKLILIRHGQSTGQASKKLGWDRKTDFRLRDCPLTSRGQEQAKQLATKFVAPSSTCRNEDERCSSTVDNQGKRSDWNKIELVVSSPLTRALQTALLAFGQIPINILVSYEIREIGSKIPENIPRDIKSVLDDLHPLLANGRQIITSETKNDHEDERRRDETTFIQKPTGLAPTSVETSVLDVATRRPKDWPRDFTPNVVMKDRIRAFLNYLYHDRPETSIAVVCHYNVIRAIVVDNPAASASKPDSANNSNKMGGSGGSDGGAFLRPENAVPIYCHLYHNGDCYLAN
jgi:broad specificity phosphatase PhoE